MLKITHSAKGFLSLPNEKDQDRATAKGFAQRSPGAVTGAVHVGSMIASDGQQLPKNPAEGTLNGIDSSQGWGCPARSRSGTC